MTRATEYRLMMQKNQEVREHYDALLSEYCEKNGRSKDSYFNWNSKNLTLRWDGFLTQEDIEFLVKMFGEIEHIRADRDLVILFKG